MNDQDIRLQCLQLASAMFYAYEGSDKADRILKAAEQLRAFVQGS
jgi:hypothetical protein